MSVHEWLSTLGDRELAAGPGPAAPVPDPGRLRVVLSAQEFEAAVKEALRNARRPADLARSPLCRSRLVADAPCDGPRAETLADLLVAATDALAGDARDAKLHRVAATTFFRGVPTQEAAAERLGLPFSTYRRHLATAIERITAWLWERELHGPEQEMGSDRTVG
jgi:hypothetical protein